MVTMLDSRSRSRFEPWPLHCVVFLARHFTLTVPLSNQEYKWVPANCQGTVRDGGLSQVTLYISSGFPESLLVPIYTPGSGGERHCESKVSCPRTQHSGIGVWA